MLLLTGLLCCMLGRFCQHSLECFLFPLFLGPTFKASNPCEIWLLALGRQSCISPVRAKPILSTFFYLLCFYLKLFLTIISLINWQIISVHSGKIIPWVTFSASSHRRNSQGLIRMYSSCSMWRKWPATRKIKWRQATESTADVQW